MFIPRYSINNELLTSIKRISNLVSQLNHRKFPKVVLVELEKIARAVSSHSSTSIEGNPLPLTEVKKILKSAPLHARDSEKEVLNYNLALQDLNKNLNKKLSLDLILKIHRQVTTQLLSVSDTGHLRNRPVVVNDPRTGKVVYLPPDATDVPTLMTDLVTYVNANTGESDPLILAGIFHKQMVIIHPFMDGNGRATRLATKVLLAQMGLDTFNLFSFENYYNQNATNYFQTVGEFGNYYELADNIDFTSWLEYFTSGIIDELYRVQKLLPQSRLLPHQLKILEYIKTHGSIADRDYARFVGRANSTRALDFQKLVKLGLIAKKAKGPSTYYTSP